MKLFTYKKKLSRGQTFSLRKKFKVKMAFTWVYLDNDGNPVENLPKEAVIEEFQTRAEAEDWLTVNWRTLLRGGIDQVSLWDGTNLAMENMSLHPISK